MTSFGGEFRMTLWPYLKMPKSENAKIGTGHTQIQHQQKSQNVHFEINGAESEFWGGKDTRIQHVFPRVIW